MRLGSFFGLPAPMILLLEDNEERLRSWLRFASEDTRTEFLYLLKVEELCEWKLPDVQQVSEGFSPMVRIDHGKSSSLSEIEMAQLGAEIRSKLIALVLKKEKMGKSKKLPENLTVYISDVMKEKSFSVAEISDFVKRLYRGLEDSDVKTTGDWVKVAEAKRVLPDAIDLTDRRITLSAEQKAMLQFVIDRKSLIQKCIEFCSNNVTNDEMIFNVSFFELILRKASSFGFMVLNRFEEVKDKRSKSFLLGAAEQCKAEADKFSACFKKYVNANEVDGIKDVRDLLFSMHDVPDWCRDYFAGLITHGEIDCSGLNNENLQVMIEVLQCIQRLDKESVERKIDCKIEDWDSWILEMCDLGVCGLNDKSLVLFDDAVRNTVFGGKMQVTKSPEDYAEIESVLANVYALLDTLRPIGEVLDE